MLTAVLLIASGALVATLYFVFTHRRHTPYLKLELDTLPPIKEGLSTLAGLTGSAVFKGNRLEVLQNGALYPAMKRDIAGAAHTVHLESFVWTRGQLEREFVELLGRKAAEGCKVRVLIDAMGGMSADKDQLKRLAESGTEVSIYCRPHWWNVRRFNHRTHRKLLIVDGAIGYTFGHGIADQWLGDGEDQEHWRDTAVRLEGPVTSALQSVFMENWIEETSCLPAGDGCYPPPAPIEGGVAAHVVSSASEEVGSKVALLYTVAIASARKEVIVQNPYFAPDDGVCELFAKMVKRGVAVHLMVPGKKTDSPFVRVAGSHLYQSLLEAGVRVYEFQPTLLHQKVVIVDRIWSHVGSTNFDARSLALNEEVGVGILDERTAQELREAFEADLRRSSELQLERWRRRPLLARGYSWLAYQLHSQL